MTAVAANVTPISPEVKHELTAGIYSDKIEKNQLDVVSNLVKSISELNTIRRKEKALFLIALLTSEGFQQAAKSLDDAIEVVRIIWSTDTMFVRRQLAVTIGKFHETIILDELSWPQRVALGHRVHDSVRWAVKELEIQKECWK